VREGDCCPVCGEKVLYKRGIEVGHIFQLGTKYTEALGVNFLDQNGKSKPVVMGTYGIGISRLIAAIVEQHHDEKGIIFPKQVAPYTVNILISNIKNKKQVEIGEALYNKLIDAGVDVILDDRKERFGFKIRDAELLGFPFTIIVGNNVENGEVELMDRKRNFKESLNIDSVFDKVMKLI
jgi:prolyl-tRNA synthetase